MDKINIRNFFHDRIVDNKYWKIRYQRSEEYFGAPPSQRIREPDNASAKFAVSVDGKLASKIWTIKTRKSDAYVYENLFMQSTSKISLHGSRICRHAFLEKVRNTPIPIENRLMQDWRRLRTPKIAGTSCALQINFLHMPQSDEALPNGVQALWSPPHGAATALLFEYIYPGSFQIQPSESKKQILARYWLSSGEILQISQRIIKPDMSNFIDFHINDGGPPSFHCTDFSEINKDGTTCIITEYLQRHN